MKKLSSKTTFIHKKLFPLFWFGLLTIFLGIGLFKTIEGTTTTGVIFIVVPIGMMVLGYFNMNFLWDLIDEVYDEGTTLLFRNRGKEFRVKLEDIKNVRYETGNPIRVTFSIRYPTDLGDELSFSPPASWIPFKKNKDIEALIDRINKLRG
jgi:hypothetical protein